MGYDGCPLPIVQPVSKVENSLAFSSSVAYTMYLYTLIRFLLSLFVSRLNSPIYGIPLYIYIPQPLHVWKMLQSHIHLCGWPHFSDSVTFSYWAAQNWTEHFRWGLSSAENGWITSLKLLAAFFLMKPRRLVAFFTVQVHFSCSA